LGTCGAAQADDELAVSKARKGFVCVFGFLASAFHFLPPTAKSSNWDFILPMYDDLAKLINSKLELINCKQSNI